VEKSSSLNDSEQIAHDALQQQLAAANARDDALTETLVWLDTERIAPLEQRCAELEALATEVSHTAEDIAYAQTVAQQLHAGAERVAGSIDVVDGITEAVGRLADRMFDIMHHVRIMAESTATAPQWPTDAQATATDRLAMTARGDRGQE